MRFRFSLVSITLACASLMSPSSALAATPDEAVTGIANTFFGKAFVADWSGIESGVLASLKALNVTAALPAAPCPAHPWRAVSERTAGPTRALRPHIQVRDTYQLRLDNTLPKRDPRDRDPGVGGCR